MKLNAFHRSLGVLAIITFASGLALAILPPAGTKEVRDLDSSGPPTCGNNTDVTVCVDPGSTTLSPSSGSGDSTSTTVTVQPMNVTNPGVVTVSSIEDGIGGNGPDTVNIQGNNTVTVTGTGGVVNVNDSSAHGTVTCTAASPAAIAVNLPNGGGTLYATQGNPVNF